MKALKKQLAKQTGQRLTELREQKGMSQNELARRLGLGHAVISRIEAGQQVLNADLVPLMAEILGVSPGDFFHRGPATERGVATDMARLLAQSWPSFPLEERRYLEALMAALQQRDHPPDREESESQASDATP